MSLSLGVVSSVVPLKQYLPKQSEKLRQTSMNPNVCPPFVICASNTKTARVAQVEITLLLKVMSFYSIVQVTSLFTQFKCCGLWTYGIAGTQRFLTFQVWHFDQQLVQYSLYHLLFQCLLEKNSLNNLWSSNEVLGITFAQYLYLYRFSDWPLGHII